MIQNFNQLPDDTVIDADLCIIGAGAAGLLIAREFIDSPTRVVLVESGGLVADEFDQDLNQGEVGDAPFRGLQAGRSRALGGTTALWGGQCIPLDPIDFEKRRWVPFSGWSIGHDVLAPYYELAKQRLGIASDEYDHPIWPRFGVAAPAFDPAKLRAVHGVFIRKPDFAKRYRREIRKAPALRVLLNANVLQLLTDPAGERIECATLAGNGGKRGSVRAKLFVLCAGGIENARLLLLSDRVQPKGLGNAHDLVGRFFQDHPCGYCATIDTDAPRFLQDRYNMLYGRLARYLPKIALSADVQRTEQVLNCVGRLTYEYETGSGLHAIKELISAAQARQWPQHAFGKFFDAARTAPILAQSAWRVAAKGLSPAPKPSRIRLEAFTEQAPDPDSRIALGATKDRFGLRRARVEWRHQEIEYRTLRVFSQTVKSEFERLGFGEVTLADWLSCGISAAEMVDSYHHAGTTRMATDERRGVVDTDCQVFGVRGLYVAGSSVFATSGAANPTLTIAAISLRLAEHLKGSLSNWPSSHPTADNRESATVAAQ